MKLAYSFLFDLFISFVGKSKSNRKNMAYNKRQKLQDNIEAIIIAFQLERENRRATPAEQEALRKYSGFGGLKFILNREDNPDSWKAADRPYYPLVKTLFNTIRANSSSDRESEELVNSIKSSVNTAFYTPDDVITAISSALYERGLTVNKFLDPSSGNGKFIDAFRHDFQKMKASAFEKDLLTGKILKALHPDDNIVVGGFETIPAEVLGSYDLAASNIPFGVVKVFDPSFDDSQVRRAAAGTLHNYFFMKALDSVREGGFIAFITSRGFMDSPSNNIIREELMKDARLVGAYRLPDGMFRDEAGTEVGSDLVILQKYSGYDISTDPFSQAFCVVEPGDKFNSGEDYSDINLNAHWWQSMVLADSESIVATQWKRGTNPYGDPTIIFTHEDGIDGISRQLKEFISRDISQEYIDYYYSNEPVQAVAVEEQKDKKPKASQTVSGPVQLDLFSMWDALEEEKISMEPRSFNVALRPNWHDGSVVVDNDQVGLLSQTRVSPIFTPMDLNAHQTDLLKQYVKIRDSYDELYRTEADEQRERADLREQLNIDYDNFFVKYGCLNDRKNQKVILFDVSGRDSLALEYSDGTKFVKADIFDRPVSFSVKAVDHVDNAVDSLFASLNRTGTVDLDYMSGISEISVDDLKEELRDRIYYNPLEGGYQVADKFLAGNVVEKYDRLAGWKPGTKEQMTELQRSLAALENVIPTPIPFEDLDFNFGERWMPTAYFSEFASNFFGTDIKIDYAPQLDEFVVDPQEPTYDKVKITSEYAIVTESGKTIDGLELLRNALYNTVPNIQHVVGYKPNGDPINGPDHEKMQLAASKIDDIRDHFTQWIDGHDKAWKEGLADLYNKKYNCFVRAKYDGSHQTFPGLDIKLLNAKKNISSIYSSQKDAVWMLLQDGGGICDHEVGTGKTLIMCIAAHEMKRLGLANKPVIIGMKANVSDIADTYQAAYPDDRLLYATPKDFSDRQFFFNRMKNNDYDCIIMSHDQFAMIPQSMEIQQQVMMEEIRALDEALEVYSRSHSVSSRMLSGLEKRKENLVIDLKNLNWQLARRADDVVDFKTMGIDHIFVDESQAFKNLAFTTRDSRVAGLGDPKGSQRARNLQYAIRTIQERTGRDLGATFLSGTTISNSLTELYLLFKYLRPDALSHQDINSFDAWAAVFAKKSRDYEINVAGQIVMKERFRNFIKVPELAAFYNEITDYKTAGDVGLERPAMNVQLVNIQPTADHQDFSQRLLDFANSGNGEYIFRDELSDSERQAKMLIVTDLGKKASLSPKLVNPEYHEGDDTKIGYAAKNISDYYHRFNEQKGTQFVFCDLSTPKKGEWNAYQELKDRLVNQYGIPEGDIQFIQDASTEKKRKEYIAKMNSGDIRVLLGSTTTLGTGVNAQQRCVAIHHLDLPWRPSDMEQRNGRGVRKGNEVAKLYADNKVDVYVYAVERSLDSYNFYLLQAKQEFIRQMKTGALGKRSFDQGGEDETNGMPFAEYVAITSGNTDLLERAKLEKRILGLESERKAFNAQQRNIAIRLDYAKEDLQNAQAILDNLHTDMVRFEDAADRDFQGNYVNTLHVGPGLLSDEDKGRYMQDNARRLITEEVEVGTIYGFPVVMRPQTLEERNSSSTYMGNIFSVKGAYSYRTNNGHVNLASRAAAASYPFEAITRLPGLVREYERRVASLEKEIPALEQVAGKEWEKVAQLAEMKQQLQELDRKIQQTMDVSIIKNNGGEGAEVLPFTITQHQYGREPWELEFMVADYPFISREDRNDIAERYHGSLGEYDGKCHGHFRHRYGAEQAMMDITKLNKQHMDDVEWLKEAVMDVHDSSSIYCYSRLKEMGLDRYGQPLEEHRHHLRAIALGEYGDVRALAHGVKDRNDVAAEVAAAALARVIDALPEAKNAVLVPMPGHSYDRDAVERLTRLVSEKTGIDYAPRYLAAAEHDSLYQWKLDHPGENLPELFMIERSEYVPQDKTPILIDNVLDTGHTAWAALEAMSHEPLMIVLGATGNHRLYDHDVDLTIDEDSVDYIRNLTPVGVGFTGKSQFEIDEMLRLARSSNWNTSYSSRSNLKRLGIDWYTGLPTYETAAAVKKWDDVYSEEELKAPVENLILAGGYDHIFSEEERKYLSAEDRQRMESVLKEFENVSLGHFAENTSLARRLLVNYEYLRGKAELAMEQNIDVAVVVEQQPVALSADEQKYFDMAKADISGEVILSDDQLQDIAKAIASSVANHTQVPDWEQRDTVKSQLRVQLKRVLRAGGYPADDITAVVDGVMMSLTGDVQKDVAPAALVPQMNLDTDEVFLQNHSEEERVSLRYSDGESFDEYLQRNGLRRDDREAMLYFHDKYSADQWAAVDDLFNSINKYSAYAVGNKVASLEFVSDKEEAMALENLQQVIDPETIVPYLDGVANHFRILTVEDSPMMRQFHDLKAKHPDALLLFRCGDFYETYEKDADNAAKTLGITLTWRNTNMPDFDTYKGAMAGFPHHALDTYLPKLIRAGYRVAICDQLEAPKQTVKRGITELVEPGLGVRMQIVDRHSSLTPVEKSLMSQIVSDLETGNHLLGRPRPEGYWEFAAEHGGAVLALKQGATLTERQRDILLERANNLYEGLHDLAIDLNMDEERLRDALSVGSVNEHRSIEEYPITKEGNYWFVGNANGYGIMPQYAVQVAALYNGEQVDRDGRMMMRFVSEDDANNFVGNIRLLNDRYTNQLRDGIIEKMRRAGIAVNTDWQEGERVLARENSRVRTEVESTPQESIHSPEFKTYFGDWENDPVNASKVVGEHGEPLVVYHGTGSYGFTTFKERRAWNYNLDREEGVGLFFSSDKDNSAGYEDEDTAEELGFEHTQKGTYAVYLNLRNPLVVDFDGAWWNGRRFTYEVHDADGKVVNTFSERQAAEDFVAQQDVALTIEDVEVFSSLKRIDQYVDDARLNGYDGVIIKNVRDSHIDNHKAQPSTTYVAFSPNQIKSVNNIGTYRLDSENIYEHRVNDGEVPVILRDAEAQRVYHEIITSGTEYSDGYPAHSGALGMFMENCKYVAFDNSTNDCWVEEFTNEDIAMSWLRGELSTDEAYAQDALSSALAVTVNRQDVERAMDSNLVKRWIKAKSSHDETAMRGFMMFGFGADLIHEFAKARLGIDNKFEPGKMFYNSWELIEDLISAAKEKGLDVAIANKFVFQAGSEDVQRIMEDPEKMYSEQEMAEISKHLSPAAFNDFSAAVRSLSEAKQIQAEEERIMNYQNGDAVTKAFVLYDIAQRRLFTEHEGDERYFRQQRVWTRPDGSQGILARSQNATADMTVGTKWVLKNDVAHELMRMIATSPITEQVPLLDMMPSAMQRYLDIPSQEDRLAALQRLTDNELDAVYFAAMPNNDAVMRDVLNIFAERRGYTLDSSYQGSLAFNGAAPSGGYYGSTEERLEAWDNEELEGAQTLGDYINHRVDIGDLDFRLNDPRGGINMSDERLDAINSINQAIHEGHGTIKMYRAVPATIEEGQFRNGDWITPSLMYAQEHVRINGWDDYRIIEQEVSVDDIWWDGNDIAEWGYDDGKDRRYKNTLNNVKSDDLVTRDDMGEVIPPSLRFNERSSDIRFMYVPNSQSPIFVSNAKIALDKIKQDKATPEQWLKMLEKNGGIKSGEDRWIGLSDWLRSQTDVRVLTKQDILSYINENTIRVEEVRYMDRHDYESIPRFAEYQQEFEDIAAHLDDLWADADKEYADFMERMQDKYEDWEYEMTNEEILEEGELLRNRERYTVNEADRDAYDVAFDVMVSRHDLLFGSAFGHEDGKLFVKDASAARQILPVDHPIHDIRLDYTTKGLTNKREIALIVPTAQQYKEDDEIHFGDAGDGRAVAWVRFGEAISYRERSEAEIMQHAISMPTAASWHELADYQPVPGYKSYYNLNGGAPSKSDSILEKDGEFHIQFKGDHAEVTFNREEDMVALRRVSGTFGSLEAAVAAYNEFITRRDHRMVPEKTLVIDEIQSKRHQDGRELGYASAFNQADLDAARQVSREYSNSLYDKYIRGQHPGDDFLDYANEEERQRFDELTSRVSSLERLERNAVPDTPFEKNWHELAMKRMLRYAAENGYDRVAWTNGLQQAERYSLGGKVESIFINHSRKDEKLYSISVFDNDAKIISSVSPDNATEEDVRNLFGKNIGDQLLQGVADLDRKKARGEVPRSEAFSIQGQNLEVGGDGMKAFYDKILPSFMNKYGKQWGIQTETIDIPAIQRDGSSVGERLHSVRVTGQMKQDVMEGQPMFFRNGEHMAYGFVHNGTIYIDPRIATAETPLHEYTHLWAEVLRQRNPQEWANIVRMMKDTPELWSYVKQNYPHLRTDDQIADEALAQFSGKHGYKKLQDFVDGKQNATTIFGKIMEVLGRFWDSVSSFFGIHYANKEEVADRVLFDLLNEVNPLDYRLTAPVVNIENPAVVNDNPFARVAADRAFFDNFYREQQEGVTDNDNFKEWFGNWQVDALILEKDVRVEPIADYDTADLGGAGLQYRVISDGKVIGFIPLEGYFDFKTNSPDFLGKKEVSVVNYGFGAEIKPEYRHKGFGKAAYLAVAKELAASGHVLCSADMKNMSDDAKGLWSSLEKEGLVSFSGNRYSFNNDRLFASKIVDANGKPLVVEHGTHADFTVFDIDKIGANSRDNGLFGAGFYFATKAPAWLDDGSENYHVMKVFLDIKHPFEISDGVVDIYDEIKEKLDRAPFRGLSLTGFNGQQIPLGAYIDHIKAVDQMIAAGQHIDLMAQDEELQVYHPKDREKVWRERELSRRSGIGSLGLSWSVLINDQLGSYQFTAAAMQSGYDGVIVDRGEGYKEYVAFEPSQIKSATDNIGLYSRENNDIRYHFIGEKGALNLDLSDGGNRIDMLHHAEELEHAHSSAKDIKVVTGWERGSDGLWRYEIPSLRSFNFYGNAEYLANHPEIERYRELSHREACAALGVSGFAPLSAAEQAEINALRLNPIVRDYQYNVSMKNPDSYSLQDFIDAPQLFVAYPELKDVPVSFAMLPNGEGGNYSQDADWIGDIVDRHITINEETMSYARDLYNETAKDKVIDTFEHEIQHAIQGLEGFAQGGRPGDRITLVGSQLEKVRQELQQLESSADYQAWKDADTQYRVFKSRVAAAMQNDHPNLDAILDLTEQERQLKRNAYMLYTVDVKHQEQRINELRDYLDNGFPLTFDNYRSLAGEVEARNVASRRHLSLALRQTMLASATEDVAREQQLVSYTSRAAAYIETPAYKDLVLEDDKAIGFVVDHEGTDIYLLNLPVHELDRADGARQGLGGLDLDADYEGSIRFASEEDLKAFYRHYQDDIDYRQSRYRSINDIATKQGRLAAEDYSRLVPVEYIFKPVPPMREWIDVNNDVYFQSLPAEARQRMTYFDGLSYEQWSAANGIDTTDPLGAYYFFQKYADRKDEVIDILNNGVSRENVDTVGRQVALLSDSVAEALAFRTLLAHYDHNTNIEYYHAVQTVFDDRQRQILAQYHPELKVVQGLDAYEVEDVKLMVEDHVKEILADQFFDDDVWIKEITVIGSRSRGEAHDGSDLDILLEYGGNDVHEDTLFNALHEEPFDIDGIPVDINPINEHYSLNTEQWLLRDARWREQDRAKQVLINEQKYMATLEQVQKVLSEVLPRDGQRLEFPRGFMADDFEHRADKQMLLVDTIKRVNDRFLVGTDREGFLDISRLSESEQAFVQKLVREQQLCELIGVGKSITYSEDSPLVLLGMDENQTATYQSVSVKNAELVFKGTLTEADGTEANINLFSMSADNMEALYSHVTMMQQRNKALVADVADTYGEVFRLASGLKTHLDTPSPLYDQLDVLSQPVVRDADQPVSLRQWAADALLSIHGGEPEFVRLNELTNGRFEEFVSQLAEGMDDDQLSMLSSEVVSRRAVYSPAVLEEVYRDVLRHYNDGNLPESDAAREDLVELLGLVNSESLHAWAVNGDVRPGEYIQQLRSALTNVSVYDAAQAFDHVRQADQQAERDYVANQKSPKTDIEGRYAFVMSYFLNNYQSLTAEQKAVFQQLDHADTPDALRQWASSVRVGHALADLSDLPAAVRDEVDELAYNIAEYDEERHEELLQGFHAVGMVDDQRMSALVAISDRLHAQYPDELVLFKNGNGMSAVGQDAEQVLRLTGWPANLVYFGADNFVQLTNISSDGYEVLAEKDVNLRIVNAPVNMRPFRDQPFNETGYALQTIDYALSHVQDESILLDTNGSLNIGNFKAKTLDFHSTGLDAIAEDGEKLVIRDIPTNYYHPEGTLVVADFIRGRRDTIENALDAAVPVVEQRNVEGERLSVLSDYNNQKALHPDEILLFRQKGFVEAFGEDAERLAEALQVPLYERTVEGEKTSFVMIGMSDYMDLTENATINTHVAIANVRDPRLDISQSISRMQEQIAVDPAREGFGAEIYRLSDGGYSISLVDYRSLHAISEEINLSAEEAERYAAMTGPAAMSQRSDFVIEMANKYFGERLQLEQEYSNVRQNYDAAGLLGTAILLDEPIEHRLDDGGVERFAAYTVDEGYVMLYKSMEDAEQSFDPYMLNDLDADQQLDILSRIDLSKEGVRQQVLDNIFDKTLDDNRDVLERLKNNPVNHETVEKPYRISIGTDNRPGGVEGEFHVQF